MDYLSLIFYPALAVLLFYKAKPVKKNEWNEDYMSIGQTKALLGFCSVVIIFHHMSQKTCAPWLSNNVIVHGLDGFVYIGYLIVALFFFCSGYGIYKSYKTKANYFENFFIKRAFPILLMGFMSGVLFFTARSLMDVPFHFATIFSIGGPFMLNQYGWYVIMILILYFLFYIGFYRAKKDISGILVIAAGTIALVLFGEYFIYGTWWYNTVHLFLIGIIFAAKENEIAAFLKKRFIPVLVGCVVVTVVGFLLGNYITNVYDWIGKTYVYRIDRWVALCAQMISSVSFVIAVTMAGMKIRIGNVALDILGKMTLETYLVHGLFVQLFGFCFIENDVKPLIYIKNVSLYVLAVLVCSLPLAFGCKWLGTYLCEINNSFLSRRYEAVRERFLKSLAVVFCVIAIYCVFTWASMTTRNEAKDELIKQYSDNNLTYTEVDGVRMAAYVAGEGEHTVVILSDWSDPLPVATLRPIADGLAEKGNRVVLFQYPGRLYSDSTDMPRSAKQHAYEIHEALKNLGEEGPYILWAHTTAGLYAEQFIIDYPGEVEAFVGADAYVGEAIHKMGKSYTSLDEMQRYVEKSGEQSVKLQKIMDYINLTKLSTTAYNEMTFYKHTKEEKAVIEAAFGRYAYTEEVAADEKMIIENMLSLEYVQFPSDLPVMSILSYEASHNDCICEDWTEMHEAQFTNPDIQSVVITSYNPGFVYFNYSYPTAKTQEFIESLDNGQ